MHYLKLIRFPNLLIIVISQCIIQFGVLRVLEVQTSLDSLGFWLLVAATVFIAAGGYIINDIYDITADAINKPTKRIVAVHISKKKATISNENVKLSFSDFVSTIKRNIKKRCFFYTQFAGCLFICSLKKNV